MVFSNGCLTQILYDGSWPAEWRVLNHNVKGLSHLRCKWDSSFIIFAVVLFGLNRTINKRNSKMFSEKTFDDRVYYITLGELFSSFSVVAITAALISEIPASLKVLAASCKVVPVVITSSQRRMDFPFNISGFLTVNASFKFIFRSAALS